MTNLLPLWTDEQRADTIGARADPQLSRLAGRSVSPAW